MIQKMSRCVCVDPAIILSAEQRARLSERFTVISGWDCPSSQKSMVEGLFVHSKVGAEFIREFPNLQWIGVRAKNTSYVPDNIGDKVKVFGIPSLGATAVAEHTFALILAIAKQILCSDANVRQGKWREGLSPNFELRGKTLGIVGNGTIGKEVARIGNAFGMRIQVAQSPRRPSEGISLKELLGQSDIVSIHLSSRKENEHLFDESTLRQMKKGAILINTSRGDIIDQSSLVRLLEEQYFGGVGLDVLEKEPPSDLRIASFPEVVVTPHKGFITYETVAAMTDALVNETLKRVNRS